MFVKEEVYDPLTLRALSSPDIVIGSINCLYLMNLRRTCDNFGWFYMKRMLQVYETTEGQVDKMGKSLSPKHSTLLLSDVFRGSFCGRS